MLCRFVTSGEGIQGATGCSDSHDWSVPLRVTACLENLEMSGNLTAVREMSGILIKSGKCRGKNHVR